MGIGAENCNANPSGAYTGEIATNMLVDAGCKYVIIGHSERRAMGETDADVNAKVLAALNAGLTPIMCCGETLGAAPEPASPPSGSPCRSSWPGWRS